MLMRPVPTLEGLLGVLAVSLPHGVQLSGILPAAFSAARPAQSLRKQHKCRTHHSNSTFSPKHLHMCCCVDAAGVYAET